MRWPLRTTDTGTIDDDIIAVFEKKKTFLWRHFLNAEDKAVDEGLCQEANLIVLYAVPCWFLVACLPDTPFEEQFRLLSSIHTCLAIEDPLWRGLRFGYSEEDISWYLTEIEEAKTAFWIWVRDHTRD